MTLTPTQQTIVARAKASGGGALGVRLDDEVCAYLVAIIARDLGALDDLRDLGAPVSAALPDLLSDVSPSELRLAAMPFLPAFERLLAIDVAAETYFDCLASLHKHRLKYEKILQFQPLPTTDQIGPRALLQYGSLSSEALAAFLFWRKWLYDIDNRAAQETGYLFEPILAASIGGVRFSATASPVRRATDPTKGRQVDCIRDVNGEQWAYELKLRVTIAASGQGRWGEELAFPVDCRSSGLKPVLVVLDPTQNPKLKELTAAFDANGGSAFLGDAAWAHLEGAAGPTMARFLERYVRAPIQAILDEAPASADDLADLRLSMNGDAFSAIVGDDRLEVRRAPESAQTDDEATEADD